MAARVTRREWRWVAAVSAAIMLLTLLPYLLGFARQTAEWRFSGFVFGVEDGNSYLAKMSQGRAGAWLFRLSYSSEPQRGALFFLYYLLAGKLAAGPWPLHGQLLALFQLARLGSGFAMLLATYRFLAEFLPSPGARRAGLLLAALGGGLGWLPLLLGRESWLGSLPLDFYSPETFGFLTLYGLPHLAAARALLLLGLALHLRASAHPSPHPVPLPSPSSFLPGLLLLLLGLVQPLYVPVAWAVMGAHVAALWLSRQPAAARTALRAALVSGLLSAPIVVYTAVAFALDPVLRQWAAQNVIRSPHPLHYLLAYGLLLLPAAIGLWRLWQRDRFRAAFLAGWAAALPLLVYAPYNLNRRLAEGFFAALAALAILGLWPSSPHRRPLISFPTLLLLFTLPSTALLLAGGFAVTARPAPPVYLPTDELAAFAWLADPARAAPGGAVLAAFETGNALPAYAPLVSYVGHGPETIFLAQKLPRVEAFFRAETPHTERLALLHEGRVRYVIRGPAEAEPEDFDPASAPYLRPAASFGPYSIYEVLP